jgi:alkaline phosphatase
MNSKTMKWRAAMIGLCIAMLSVGTNAVVAEDSQSCEIKNIIFMIPDGCSQSIQTLARWYMGVDLTLDTMNAGMVRNDMADSVITDSAAAASAFASGHKTSNGFLSVGPRSDTALTTYNDQYALQRPYQPLATILEMAKYKGKSTGLVATSRITHATPAAFASHVYSRNWPNDIMEQYVYQGLTVALGGGRRHLLPGALGGKRDSASYVEFPDGENLEQVLIDRGYTMVYTRDELNAVAVQPNTKLWGAFASSHMQPDIDRQYFAPDEPSLAEMTAKAIEVLSQNQNGFFLMVEGSQVDWAGHNNDPIYMVTDFIAFDKAVKVAVDFASADGKTLVVAFPDHNTGGMKIGQYDASMAYTATKFEDLVNPLMGMTTTANGVVAMLPASWNDASYWNHNELRDAIQTYWGIEATSADLAEIFDLKDSVGLSYAIARVISKNHTVIGWTTHGHNGEDVPVWIYPHSEAIGVIDNTDLPDAIQYWTTPTGANTLAELTEELFVNVDDEFPANQWSLEKHTANGVVTDMDLVIYKMGRKFRLPVNKNYIIVNGKKKITFDGIVVYAPYREDGAGHFEERVYIPREAVHLIDWYGFY